MFLLGAVLLLAQSALAAGACSDDAEPAPRPFKQNYVLPLLYDSVAPPAGDPRQPLESKFQISLMYPVNWLVPWSVGYTQKSYWQVYDQQHSRPFREPNYNPEIFVDCPALSWLPEELGLRGGVEHESNGQSVALSRSWTRAYLWPRYRVSELLEAQLKLWYRFPEEQKRSPADPVGDDNPDLEDYLGYGEAYLLIGATTGHHAHIMIRKGRLDRSGTYELDGFFKLSGSDGAPGLSLMLQFFSGYGESLIDYNHRVDKVGLGVAF